MQVAPDPPPFLLARRDELLARRLQLGRQPGRVDCHRQRYGDQAEHIRSADDNPDSPDRTPTSSVPTDFTAVRQLQRYDGTARDNAAVGDELAVDR